jgi:hypothetical protein
LLCKRNRIGSPIDHSSGIRRVAPSTYYYDRDKLDGTINRASAGGGWLAYHSGLLANTFHIGLTYFTSNPIIAPDNEGGTLLLTSEQDPINTLGVAYIGAQFWGQDLQVGRQMVDTPLINRRDNRMVPITFAKVRPSVRIRGKTPGLNTSLAICNSSDHVTATTLT